jgi:hypothetical protein
VSATEPRLFPEFAAVPTRGERASVRRFWRDRQTSLLVDVDLQEPPACVVCAGDHAGPCGHGSALTLRLED